MAEATIVNEIRIIVNAADNARLAADRKEYDDAVKQLQLIDAQAKKLKETGGIAGLKELPKLKEVEQIKIEVSAARTAAEEALTAIRKLKSLSAKEEITCQKEIKRSICRVKDEAIAAAFLAENNPWINPVILSKPENRDSLISLLKRQGYYQYLRSDRIDAVSRKLILVRIDLSGEDLKGVILEWVNLDEANLHKANLSEARLTGTRLSYADISGADLSNTSLRKAKLRGTNLIGAKLVQADLSGANLDQAFLMDADLTRANFSRATLIVTDLTGANLTGAKNLTEEQLKYAILK